MHKFGLQMGSIDMIFSTEGDYVFLEVNPSGQFTGYANPCNYNIEKHIAEYLIATDNEENWNPLSAQPVWSSHTC